MKIHVKKIKSGKWQNFFPYFKTAKEPWVVNTQHGYLQQRGRIRYDSTIDNVPGKVRDSFAWLLAGCLSSPTLEFVLLRCLAARTGLTDALAWLWTTNDRSAQAAWLFLAKVCGFSLQESSNVWERSTPTSHQFPLTQLKMRKGLLDKCQVRANQVLRHKTTSVAMHVAVDINLR